MSKELPYFKFVPAEWITGNITLCSMEAQGLFINLCAFYWIKDCSISIANAKQRFSNCFDLLSELKANEIIEISSDEKIIINFLDEQMSKFTDISIKRSESAKLKGKAKAKQKLSKSTAKAPYIREDKNIDKIRKDKNIIPPPLNLVIQYCQERKNNIDPYYFHDYNEARGWKINGKIMKDWQATIRTWEKNNYNIKKSNNNSEDFQRQVREIMERDANKK